MNAKNHPFVADVAIEAPHHPQFERQVLTPDARQFLYALHQEFNYQRLALLERRRQRQHQISQGRSFGFLPETEHIRRSEWKVAATPADLLDRRVEITGPAEAKMMINALNSGSRAFMCDFEDSLSPTWTNVMQGQINVQAAVRRQLAFTSEAGKEYKLNDKIATLLLRPRGWHLAEKHLTVDGTPMSGALVDFGLAFFHNAKEQLARGSGPYFYLPKMESHLEARLWNQVFNFAQDYLGIPRGTIKVTVLIETLPAAFEMDEILFELRDHITGLNAGRWDYIFSIIKKFSHDQSRHLPDRSQVTMTVPFMRAYTDLLVKTCHKRGAHAMGGMAAFIPSRKDPEVNRVAMTKVKEDKDREANAGFDGTWIAHPDLVEIATKAFDAVLGERPNQREKLRSEVQVSAADLTNLNVPGGKITVAGVVGNINVALQYIDQWLRGNGAVALHNLMEDAATAEIARAQLWQWTHQGCMLDDGRHLNKELFRKLRDAELDKLGVSDYVRAAEILDGLVLDPEFAEFLTLPAYAELTP
jgi:malate synthase